MVVCGGLAYSWSIAVIGVIADALSNKARTPLMIYKGNEANAGATVSAAASGNWGQALGQAAASAQVASLTS